MRDAVPPPPPPQWVQIEKDIWAAIKAVKNSDVLDLPYDFGEDHGEQEELRCRYSDALCAC